MSPSRDETDTAYGARATVSDAEFDSTIERYRTTSDEAIATMKGAREIRFDPGSDERLDVWGAGDRDLRPVVVAVHGGYWRMLSRHDTAFMARALDAAGTATVPIDYTLAPEASLEEIVRQVRAAIAWVHRNGAEHGLDPDRIHVVGSSAGAHLAAMTALAGWQEELGLPPDVVKGALTISGLFDLRPLVDSFANEWLGLDQERAAALSPALAPVGPARMSVALAADEASGFREQSRDFHRRWQAHGATYDVVPGRNHFDVFLDLADPDSTLFHRLLQFVDVSRPGR
ncbi:MAG: alpha/beta hydrolase [Nocardioides sp.]|nr:alpha/beta hydrolase [Nocardioides sp.]